MLAALLCMLFPMCLPAQERPCKPTVTGHVDVFSLVSSTFHNTRNLRVWLPPGYDDSGNGSKKYPVLYILDGASAFDACTAFLHDEMHADETLAELITSGRIPPLVAVAIDNASDIIGLDADGHNKDNGDARAREYLAYADTLVSPAIQDFRGAELPQFFEHDVMPAIAARYRVMSGASSAALWGDSYAGAAALYLAIERPDLFDRMIIESPSLQVGNGRFLRDSASLTSVPHRIALGIGTDEVLQSQFPNSAKFNAAWVRMMHTLADNLRAAAYIAPEVQLTIAEGAHHTTGEFGKRFAAGLLFIYAPPGAETAVER
jgi:predicted alpha/beta superfamily hydrolase